MTLKIRWISDMQKLSESDNISIRNRTPSHPAWDVPQVMESFYQLHFYGHFPVKRGLATPHHFLPPSFTRRTCDDKCLLQAGRRCCHPANSNQSTGLWNHSPREEPCNLYLKCVTHLVLVHITLQKTVSKILYYWQNKPNELNTTTTTTTKIRQLYSDRINQIT